MYQIQALNVYVTFLIFSFDLPSFTIFLGENKLHIIIIIMILIKLFRIGSVTGPRLAVLDRGRRPRSNTADRGPVTGPIRNNLINEIFIN